MTETTVALPAVPTTGTDVAVPSFAKFTNNLSSLDKAAIILTAIGPDQAAPFLKELNESSLTQIATAVSTISDVSPEVLDQVIAEFILAIGSDEVVSGGIKAARRLLGLVLEEDAIERIMFEVEGGDNRKVWKKLNDIPNAALAVFVGAEHPQTAAVILSELRADKAAGVIERLDQEFAQQTVLRLSRVPSIETRVSEILEKIIAREFLSAGQRTRRNRKPAEVIAGLMNNLASDTREGFLSFLEEQKPVLAKEVQRVMFTFADIRQRVETRDIPAVAKAIDEQVMVVALKSAAAQKIASVEYILSNIPKRLSERLSEDLESMPDVSAKDGEAAQQEVVKTIQDMAKTGKISLIEDEVFD